MSYRDDLRAFRQARDVRKKQIFLLMKITVVLLALVIVATTVLVIAEIASGDSNSFVFNIFNFGFNENTDEISSAKDRKSPVVSIANGGDTIYVYVGETVSWKNAIKVIDDSSCQISVDNSKVNIDKVGTYTVIYTVTDAAGNTTKFEADVVVTKAEYSYNTLMTVIEKKAASLGITKSMSKKEQVRAIYDYVNSPDKKNASDANIVFVDESNIPSIDRDNWENDWIEEAIRTLSKEQGDCYSYYSVSKAFFEYFGIENKGIQRSASSSESGTHFWSMVNVGDAKNPQWYFYDGTRLAGEFEDGTNDGCLRTLSELKSYRTSKGGKEFYTYDESAYPKAASTKIER